MGARKIGFDGWVLDPDSGDLERAGTRIRLQEQPLQVLMQLIDSRGGVVTREQLTSKLWPTGIVDFDTGANTAIRKLRVALGDTADTPRYIETLPRRGYRFIAALEPDPAHEPEPEAQPQPELAAGLPTSDVLPVRTMEDSPPQTAVPPRTVYRRYIALLTAFTLALVGVAVVWVWISREPARESAVTVTPSFSPPPHSVAVLPFVNVSGDKDQEYFSDGLSDELINMLTKVPELRVPARTSSFYFKGKQATIADIAKALGVAHVLEGSVRKSGNTLRITAQLVRVDNGYDVWSETYDRKLDDIFKIQDDIASSVVTALRVHLLGDEAAKIEVGGTHNAAAFDAHLRALQAYWKVRNAKDSQAAIAGFTEAIRLDPDYAVSYADRSLALLGFATRLAATNSSGRIALDKALADARKAVALAPNLGEGHLALACVYSPLREFTPAVEEYERALALAPRNVRVLRDYGAFAVNMGRTDSGLNSLRRAAELDPLNAISRAYLGAALSTLRRYEEAIAAYKQGLAFGGDPGIHAAIGETYYLLGDLQSARTSCEENAGETLDVQFCLALTYDKLGRHADAEAELAKIQATAGDSGAYTYAAIYAQWGHPAKALEWLETALRLRDPGLESLKAEPLLDPLRKEPRFQAIERELKFPE